MKPLGGSTELVLQLPPYGSGFLVFGGSPEAAPRIADQNGGHAAFERMKFWLDGSKPEIVTLPHSWSASAAGVFYSGLAHYEFEVTLPADADIAPNRVSLHLGLIEPIEQTSPAKNGMRAWLDAPVRDVAVVYVNGVRAGAAWCPPYKVSLSALHPGTNTIRIDVANTAMNEMAGMALPDYRLLNLRYGMRFEAQDMDQIAPQPSGLLTHNVFVSWSHGESHVAR